MWRAEPRRTSTGAGRRSRWSCSGVSGISPVGGCTRCTSIISEQASRRWQSRHRNRDGAFVTRQAALAFVRRHGVVLEAARGPVPSFAEAVAKGPIRGSWWGHPKGQEIFALTRAVRDSRDVLVCRLVRGKVTYVHRRVWPAVVRLARTFTKRDLAAFKEVHTANGEHAIKMVPFPRWVPVTTRRQAERLSLAQARVALGSALTSTARAGSATPQSRSPAPSHRAPGSRSARVPRRPRPASPRRPPSR